MTATTVIGLLGPVSVGTGQTGQIGPRDLAGVPGTRARRLLAALVLAGGRARAADRLIDDVWGDEPPRSPAAALQTQISRLRPLLGAGGIEGMGNGYRLRDCVSDLDIVDGLIAAADAESLAAASAWWRGTPGDDLGEGSPVRAELSERAERVADRLDGRRIAVALDEGDYDTAIALSEKRCSRDVLDESAHLSLMQALAGAGRVADALGVYARVRRSLSAELGVDPGAQLAAFHDELLAGPQGSPSPPRRSVRTSGLSADTTELIGREGDVAALAGLLERHRLVTVQGPGGVGKTRVANRVGRTCAESGREVFYVPLAPIRSGDDLVPAIAAALGVGETEISSSGRPRIQVGDLAERLVDTIRGRRLLLILDNCEQIIDACAAVVADLLRAEPQLTVLTTSRAPLQLAAEYIYLLGVLDVDGAGPAVRLFTERARAVRPDADLPRDAVADLCRHLDGLPLAIELAAARIRTMTVDEISERLAERFALLRGSDRSAPDRHRTLHAVIEWSWDLLDDDARAALCRLCRFPGGFTATAAAEVLGHGGFRLDDTLASLVNQSLLAIRESGGRVRYRMLEMVREFGEEKLSNAGGDVGVTGAMRRWANAFAVEITARFDRAIDDQLLDTVTADQENLVWVLRDCLHEIEHDLERGATANSDSVICVVRVFPVLAAYWMARGLHAEVLSWGPRIVGVLPTPAADLGDDLRRGWMTTVLACLAHQMVERDLRVLATARYHLRILHHPDETYSEPTDLVAACVLAPSVPAAIRHVVRGTEATDGRVAAVALSIRMNLRENFAHYDGALRDALALQTRAHAGHDSWTTAMVEVSVGGIYGQQAQWRTAVEHYRRGIARLRRLGAHEDEMQSRCYLVVTLVALGELDSAAAELDAVSDGWTPADPDPQGNPETAAAVLLCFAELEFARGHVASAADLYARAGDLVTREHPFGARDPGVVMLVGVSVVGLVRTGRLERIPDLVKVLAEGIAETLSMSGWGDIPQVGTATLAAGYALRADDSTRSAGARLMALAQKLHARKDYPGFAAIIDDMAELSGLPPDEWSALATPIAAMSRRQAVGEVQDILAPWMTGGRHSPAP